MKFLTFLLLLATIAYSEAATVRSAADIQKYEQFLRDSVHGEPDASLSPETLSWEDSGKFEGDIILSEEEIKQLVDVYAGKRNGVIDPAMLWPDAELVYKIDTDDFNEEQREYIRNATDYISSISCITFKEITKDVGNYVDVFGAGGCSAEVGYRRRVQTLKLHAQDLGSGCFNKFSIAHEFLHALGFYHMQSSYNRDDYVIVNLDNVKPGYENNYNKFTSDQVTLLGTEYDYGSVMHYGNTTFAIDKTIPTMTPIKPLGDLVMGQRDNFSESDIERLNTLYECEDRKTKSKK